MLRASLNAPGCDGKLAEIDSVASRVTGPSCSLVTGGDGSVWSVPACWLPDACGVLVASCLS